MAKKQRTTRESASPKAAEPRPVAPGWDAEGAESSTPEEPSATPRPRTTDARPVAALRIGLAFVTMVALLDVSANSAEWLSDVGVMPRAAFLDASARLQRICLLDSVGQPWQVAVYLAATYASLVALLVGYRTRLASVLSFVLVAGIYERNYYLFDGADTVIRTMLFWLMFVDAGAAYSVDARLRGSDDTRARSPLVPVLVAEAQIAWVYLATAVIKLGHPLWRDGTALHYALSTPHVFTRGWATAFRDDVWLVKSGTYATLVFELAFPLLVLGLRRYPAARLTALIAGVLFHAGTVVALDIGSFPMVMLVCYAIYCEPAWLARPLAWVDAKLLRPLAARLQAREGSAPSTTTQRTGAPRPGLASRFRDVALPVLFATAAWNGIHADDFADFPTPPAAIAAIPQTLSLWQRWDMFAPDPIRSDYYVEVRGVRLDGRQVDALLEAPGGEIAEHERGLFYDRWTKFMHAVAFGRRAVHLPFARYVCRRWNLDRDGAERLASLRVVRIERRIAPLGEPENPARAVPVYEHTCYLGGR